MAFTASTPGHADDTTKTKPADNNKTSQPPTNNPASNKPVQTKPNPAPNPPVNPSGVPGAVPGKNEPGQAGPRNLVRPPPDDRSKPPPGSQLQLKNRSTPHGFEMATSSGVVRDKVEKGPDGQQHAQHFTPTGRMESDAVVKPDGAVQKTYYNPSGKICREEIDHTDGSREVSNLRRGRNGNVRVTETIQYDSHRRAVSKTVEKTIIIGKTGRRTMIVNHYEAGRFGLAYRPSYARPQVFVTWYDPFWYAPDGTPIYHPFAWNWGWNNDGWYLRYHGSYWTTYGVYPTPSYWVTDRVIADYLADHYEDQVTVDQARQEAQQARAEAIQAQQLAQQSQDAAEIAEAKAAEAAAELRAKSAEDKLAQLQSAAASGNGKPAQPNPNATPIDNATKDAVKAQIEATVAENKQYADQVAKGQNPPLPDVSKSLADPQHVYLVSADVSVTSAKDSTPAGTLSEGDVLKLDISQAIVVNDLTEATLLTMRVIASKGEDGEVTAGTLIQLSVK
jgi:hypothetical protein